MGEVVQFPISGEPDAVQTLVMREFKRTIPRLQKLERLGGERALGMFALAIFETARMIIEEELPTAS